MAKLPGLTYGGAPQSLGRENIDLPAQLAAARIGIAQQISQSVQEGVDLWDKETARKANVNTANRMMDFEGVHRGKSFYNGDELPESIPDDIRYEEKDGELVARQNIPSYQVYPIMLEEAQRKILEEESKSILLPGTRNNWIQDKQVTAASKVMEAMGVARAQQAKQIQQAELFDINQAIDQQRYGLAAELISEYSGSELDKEKQVADLMVRQEADVLEGLMVSEDVEGMKNAISKISEGKTNLPATKGRQYARMMRTEIARVQANVKKEQLGLRADEEVERQLTTDRTPEQQLENVRAQPAATEAAQAVKDETVKRLKIRHAEQTATGRRNELEKTKAFWADFLESPDPQKISADLPAETQKAAYTYALKRAQGPIVTDRVKQYELEQMIRADFGGFQRLNLLNYKPYLDDGDWDKYAALQRKAPTSPEIQTAQSLTAQVNNALVGMGVNPRPRGRGIMRKSVQVAAFRNLVDSELAIAAEVKGKKLSPSERKQVIDDISMQIRREKWLGASSEDLGVDDIPNEDLHAIPWLVQGLRATGAPINGINIIRAYEAAKNKNMLPSRR